MFVRQNPYRQSLLLLILAGMVFLIYSNTFTCPFYLDDWVNIATNSSVQITELSFASLKRAVIDSPITSRPVANISLAINYYFHQFSMPGFHLVNIIIHLAAGIFLYLFIKTTLSLPSQRQQIGSVKWLPFAVALLWVVNPVHVQSVTYIIQRMNSMVAMFYILSMLLYAKARLAAKTSSKTILFGGCAIAALLAIGSKEIGVTLLFFIVLYEWFFLQDLSFSWLKRRMLLLTGVGVLLILVVLFFLGMEPLNTIKSSYASRDFSMYQRVLTEPRVVLFYLSLLLFPYPWRMNLEHDFILSNSLVDPVTTLLSGGLLLGLFIVAIVLAKKERLLSFCILWFLGNLVIESSVIGLEIVFEHRTYLPSMMVACAAVILGNRLLKTWWLKTAVMIMVILLFATWTYQRNAVWQDDVAMARDSVAKSPNMPRAHMNLAWNLERKKAYDEAVKSYYKTLSLNPTNYVDMVHFNLGNVLLAQEKIDEAVKHYQTARSLSKEKPDYMYLNPAIALAKYGRLQKAAEVMEEMLERYPDHALGYNNLGLIVLAQGKAASAEYYFTEAIKFGSKDAASNLEKAKLARAKQKIPRSYPIRRPAR